MGYTTTYILVYAKYSSESTPKFLAPGNYGALRAWGPRCEGGERLVAVGAPHEFSVTRMYHLAYVVLMMTRFKPFRADFNNRETDAEK